MSFRDDQVRVLEASGWVACPSVVEGVVAAGLPVPDAGYLRGAFEDSRWRAAEQAVSALRAHYAGARFADQCEWDVLLVPDVRRLDTRGALDPSVRRDQVGGAAGDVVDSRLPGGVVGVPAGPEWSMVATVTGAAGVSLGSYQEVVAAPETAHRVAGVDARELMIRQVWGARVLQRGVAPPDCPDRPQWTFTLFPGEEVVDGLAVSGTVLHGRVRFRLGKTDRGIGSARVCPAVLVR